MKFFRRMSTLQSLAVGFMCIILAGALILMLPCANRDGGTVAFVDALFTAVSATCVTGLSVFDVYTQFTFFGQLIILLLIQIGGLGFMTVAISFSLMLGRRIGLRRRMLLAEAVSAWQIGGVTRLAGRIFGGTILLEVLGAALLAVRFCPLLGMGQGIWFSVFHAVSAFCNAGFDLMGALSAGGSMTYFAEDPYVLLVLSALIIIGGIGFLVWNDLLECRFRWRKFCLQTKIMLTATAFLLIVPTGLYLLLERSVAFAGMSVPQAVLSAFFQTVTTRTAGFFTFDNQKLSEGGWLLTVFLMFVGAGAGSTGGGVKITTVTAVFLALRAHIRRRKEINAFHRRLSDETVGRAFTTVAIYSLLLFGGCFMLSALQNLPVRQTLYEAASAIGTVGLSSGITGLLNTGGKIIVMILMFCGRMGSLSLAMAVTRSKKSSGLLYPEGKIITG